MILQYLKKQSQCLDSEIVAAIGIPIAEIRDAMSAMSARGDIMRCSVTRFRDGAPVEEMQSRIAGFVPPPAPGRKVGSTKDKGTLSSIVTKRL